MGDDLTTPQLLKDAYYMAMALEQARQFLGATAPNPPVGAIIVDTHGRILAQAAHERAGEHHAEFKAVESAEKSFGSEALKKATLYVTLEPCHHQGKTPPCTALLEKIPWARIVIGCHDPNPHVAGHGADYLKSRGIHLTEGVLSEEISVLLRPFFTKVLLGRPYIVLKSALRAARTDEGLTTGPTLIPPLGQTVFTHPELLTWAHELRKQSDAFITGMGTILADFPQLTIRHVADHVGKKRLLIMIDSAQQDSRNRLLPDQAQRLAQWEQDRALQGFIIEKASDFKTAIERLSETSVLQVLVEAGPRLTEKILQSGLWDQHFLVHHELKKVYTWSHEKAGVKVPYVYRNH